MEDPDSALKPGYTLDRYELLCQLASGGMATVWLARMQGKRGFEKLLAVKTIKSELSGDPRFEEMFLDEARIASGIHHPNVAQIIDLGEQDDILYLVMEWVDGESLAQIRRVAAKNGAKMPLGVALRVAADSCAGLHAAHELRDAGGKNVGVVHRDVSPQNILVSTAGSVKIIDFGVAKAANRLAPETRTGILKGKLQYMAPEQALDHPVDRRADLWALGVCIYEIVADRMPFDGENQLSMLNKICSGEPPPPLGDDVPKAVKEIVAQALARNPDDRFPTAAAMRRAIEAAIVELALPSSSEDLVAFVEANLPERAIRREEIISRALKKAAARAEEAAKVLTGTVRVAKDGGPVDSELVRASELATRSSRRCRVRPSPSSSRLRARRRGHPEPTPR